MYQSTVIDMLALRIAFAEPMQPSPIVLEVRNSAGTSGRKARRFHSLVTVENIWLTMPAPTQGITAQADNATLNEHLYDLKREAVLAVLAAVFDKNALATVGKDSCGNPVDISDTDYTNKITINPARFDDAIGYQIAYMALEQMLTSTRTNPTELKIADKGQLRLEQEGFAMDGTRVSPGVAGKLRAALKDLIGSLFPTVAEKPKLRARHVW